MAHILHDHIRKDALAMCDIGNRFVGTPGEVAARAYIMERFRDVGLTNVREEPFEVATYRPSSTLCEMVGSAYPDALSCVGLQFTAGGEITADTVFIGSPASENELERSIAQVGSVEGRIVVFDSSYPYLFAERLVEHGAVGLIVTSDAPDGHVCHLNAMMYPALAARPNGARLPIPGIAVEREDSKLLLAHIEKGLGRVRLAHNASYDLVTTANIIGELESSQSDERAVLGAHYDSQLDGVGASDNAAGIGGLIDAARYLALRPRCRTIVVVAFADEEGGFRGSAQYCRTHAQTIGKTIGMVNIDAPGWSPSERSLHADPAMHKFARDSAASIGWIPYEEMDASAFPGSDHNPFIDAGVPACFFWRHPPRHPYYHTAGDTPDILDFGVVADTVEASSATIHRLATIDTMQLGRSRPSRRWLDLRPEGRAGAAIV